MNHMEAHLPSWRRPRRAQVQARLSRLGRGRRVPTQTPTRVEEGTRPNRPKPRLRDG